MPIVSSWKAGLHLADLLLWSEADTGFAAAGSVWLRYIPWLAAFALPYLPARRAAAQPAGLQDTNKPLGVCMALAGAALLASGVAAGNTARYAILYPEVLSGSCPVWAAWADLLLPIFAGAWLLRLAAVVPRARLTGSCGASSLAPGCGPPWRPPATARGGGKLGAEGGGLGTQRNCRACPETTWPP